ncbi:signal peptide peptidase SppA [Marivirga lumbricoides]|uniref:Signal peptide peptidase SppA n=2 Tax=Marivirga lumbricoides TaxID=1046115 RepID=A0ABQ1N7W9_9BACT|nr:signal peptide peptidase SppA [Marivirga lumbricoides]
MKSFFKIFFASLLAFIVFNLVLLFLFIGIASSGEETVVPTNAYLQLDLSRPIVEMTADDPFAELGQALGNEAAPLGLKSVLNTLKHAATDDNIKGIYLNSSFVMAGFAQLEEIRNALIKFKESGKPVIAYAETFSESGYYVASVADEIILNPVGMLEVNGLTSEVMFFKGTFEKLNIEPQIFRVGTFKSAVEPFLRKDMSEPSKQQVGELLNSVYDHYLAEVAEARGISVDELTRISDQFLVRTPQDALKYGLVTSLGYYDEVLAIMRENAGLEADADIPSISVNKYEKSFVADSYQQNRIAVIVAEGNIVSGEGDAQSIGSDKFAKEIRKARLDDKIKAIVLRINSPGGSALASDVMWREVQLAKQVKPVIASMSSVAASGGYYMAMACDTIVAQPNTITGSIGIFAIIPDLSNFLESKIGVTFDRVSTGEYSDLYTVTRSLNEAEKQIIQNMVERGYEDFTTKAAEGRDMPVEQLLEVASGRVWSGVEAKDRGLVDVLGGYDDAVRIAAEAAGLEEGKYMKVYYPEMKPFFQQLMEELGSSASVLYDRVMYGEASAYVKELKYVMENKGLQTRMPFDLEIK